MVEDVLIVDEAFEFIRDYIFLAFSFAFVVKIFCVAKRYKLCHELMQSYPPRVLDRRLQEAWARATKEGPRVLMNLRVDF